MLVGINDGVQITDVRPQALRPEIRRGINHQQHGIACDENGRAQALVQRIGRRADRAIATDVGHPVGGAGSEKGDFQGNGSG